MDYTNEEGEFQFNAVIMRSDIYAAVSTSDHAE